MTSKFLLLFLERDFFFIGKYYVILTGYNDICNNMYYEKHGNIWKKKYIRLY